MAEENELFMIHALCKKPLFSDKLTLKKGKNDQAKEIMDAMKFKISEVYLGRLLVVSDSSRLSWLFKTTGQFP